MSTGFTAAYEITTELVRGWAELSDDFNPLHLEPDFAATTAYGRTIAHGPLIASCTLETLASFAGPKNVPTLTVVFRFIAPVFVPSVIEIRGSDAAARQDEEVAMGRAHYDVEVLDHEGRLCMKALARWTIVP